jgi:gliding motility-associated-like protein
MKKLFISLSINLLAFSAFSQVSISPQVLNAGGSHRQVGSSGYWITDNVGEPFTQSSGYNVASFMITEGFIQPDKISLAGFTLSAITQSLMCADKEDDAFISLSIASTVKKFDAKYFWSPNTICPTNDCAKVDTLKPGQYDVLVAIQYTTNVGIVRYDTLTQSFLINQSTVPCKIKVFNGISANGDNMNDFLNIENIKEYPNNRVTIYTRWGGMLADIKGYNPEMSGKRWPSSEELTKLQSTTYFYIIELGDGTKPIKGWVELIKD